MRLPAEYCPAGLSEGRRQAQAGPCIAKPRQGRRRRWPYVIANYLKVAIRNLMRNKTFSAINILGLAIGMACCMLILLYVQDELSYDRHHENADRIFRLAEEVRIEGRTRWIAITQYPAGPALVQDYPIVVDAIRFYRDDAKMLVGNQHVKFYEKDLLFTDANVFKVFDFPLIKGDPRTALQKPDSIVLTEAMAWKYFGDREPLGQTLTVSGRTYKVTGVLKHTNHRSHLQFDFLASPVKEKDWFEHDYYTYLLLQDKLAVAELERQLPDFVHRHIGRQIKAAGIELKLFLQPVADIHLHSHLEFEISPTGISGISISFSSSPFLSCCLPVSILQTFRPPARCTGQRRSEYGERSVQSDGS